IILIARSGYCALAGAARPANTTAAANANTNRLIVVLPMDSPLWMLAENTLAHADSRKQSRRKAKSAPIVACRPGALAHRGETASGARNSILPGLHAVAVRA